MKKNMSGSAVLNTIRHWGDQLPERGSRGKERGIRLIQKYPVLRKESLLLVERLAVDNPVGRIVSAAGLVAVLNPVTARHTCKLSRGNNAIIGQDIGFAIKI